MKQKLFILFFSLTASRLHAQSLEMRVIGSAGTFQTASWGFLSSTVGEAITYTLSASSKILTQGFQQPLPTVEKVNNIVSAINISVFPNPAAGFINVVIVNENANKHYAVGLFDLLGQKLDIKCEAVNNGKETNLKFDLTPLANGSYLISITDEDNLPVKSVKFTKIQ